MAPENPQIVGEGDDCFFGLGLGVGVRWVDRDGFGDRGHVAVTVVGRSGKRANFFFFRHGIKLLAPLRSSMSCSSFSALLRRRARWIRPATMTSMAFTPMRLPLLSGM